MYLVGLVGGFVVMVVLGLVCWGFCLFGEGFSGFFLLVILK